MSERDEVNTFACQTEWESVPDENPYVDVSCVSLYLLEEVSVAQSDSACSELI